MLGSHTYFNAGDFPVAVNVVNPPSTSTTMLDGVIFTVSDNGSAIVIASTAVIVSPTIVATPLPITVVEDRLFTRSLVSFTATNFPDDIVSALPWE